MFLSLIVCAQPYNKHRKSNCLHYLTDCYLPPHPPDRFLLENIQKYSDSNSKKQPLPYSSPTTSGHMYKTKAFTSSPFLDH